MRSSSRIVNIKTRVTRGTKLGVEDVKPGLNEEMTTQAAFQQTMATEEMNNQLEDKRQDQDNKEGHN